MTISTGVLVLAFMTAAPATSTTAAATPLPPAEKIICRYFQETGSLVKRNKVCHTRREWSELNDSSRRDMESLAGKNGSGQSGN